MEIEHTYGQNDCHTVFIVGLLFDKNKGTSRIFSMLLNLLHSERPKYGLAICFMALRVLYAYKQYNFIEGTALFYKMKLC